MARVFITGISGFIGSYLARELIRDGHQVAGLLRQTNRLNYPEVQELLGEVAMYYGSITDYAAVRLGVADFQPEYVCHLGAITPVAYSFDHPHEVTDTNYIGTMNLAEATLKECHSLKKFIFASSMEVYGAQEARQPFVETLEPKPACPYAVAKLASEKYLQYLHYAYGFPAVTFRQTNCYGRRENDYFVVEAIVVQMLKSKSIRLGGPRPLRNFLWVDDLTNLYKTVIASDDPGLLGQVYNTGPSNGLTIEELASKIGGILDWDGDIQWYTRPRRPGEIFYLNSSSQKITDQIGWEPRTDLDVGLRRSIEIWKKNLEL